MALAATIKNADDGDTIFCHSDGMRQMAERAHARMCPDKTLVFKAGDPQPCPDSTRDGLLSHIIDCRMTSKPRYSVARTLCTMPPQLRESYDAITADSPPPESLAHKDALLDLLNIAERLRAYDAHYSVATHEEWFSLIRDTKAAIAKTEGLLED